MNLKIKLNFCMKRIILVLRFYLWSLATQEMDSFKCSDFVFEMDSIALTNFTFYDEKLKVYCRMHRKKRLWI